VAFALMELFRVTGRSQYREAAEQAFNYERHWFNIEACNWPDFRDEPGESKRTKRPLRFSSAWCHGAPGIALSRLRAYEIVKDPTCKEEAITALQTTCRVTKTWLDSSTGNYSLCHGICGNAEILFYGWQVLGQDFVEGLTIAHAVANTRIANSTKCNGLRPRRGKDEEPLGLMLGLAGIGYFYLRLYNYSIRSVLSLVTKP
jgi:lantibiotic modifying enzyme